MTNQRPTIPLSLRWSVETSRPCPYAAQAYRGESVVLSASLDEYGAAVDLTGASAALYWHPVGAEDPTAWWEAPAAAAGNVVSATFDAASMDDGHDAYVFFLQAAGAGGKCYRANGVIRMLASPGAVPNEIPFPPRVLDFDLVEVHNAPYYSKDETDAALYGKADVDDIPDVVAPDDDATTGQAADAAATKAALDEKAAASDLAAKRDMSDLSYIDMTDGGITFTVTNGTFNDEPEAMLDGEFRYFESLPFDENGAWAKDEQTSDPLFSRTESGRILWYAGGAVVEFDGLGPHDLEADASGGAGLAVFRAHVVGTRAQTRIATLADAPAVVAPDDDATTGQAADAAATKNALDAKVDETAIVPPSGATDEGQVAKATSVRDAFNSLYESLATLGGMFQTKADVAASVSTLPLSAVAARSRDVYTVAVTDASQAVAVALPALEYNKVLDIEVVLEVGTGAGIGSISFTVNGSAQTPTWLDEPTWMAGKTNGLAVRLINIGGTYTLLANKYGEW